MSEMNEAQRLTEGLTKLILEVIETGAIVVSKDGTQMRVTAGPSYIREARAWLKELESGNHAVMHGNSPQGRLLQAAMMRFKGQDIPVDEDLADTGS